MPKNLKKALKESEANLSIKSAQLEVITETLQKKEADLSSLKLRFDESQVAFLQQSGKLLTEKSNLKHKEADHCESERLLFLERQDLQMRNSLLVEKTSELAASAVELNKLSVSLAKAQEKSLSHARELEKRNADLTEAIAKLNNLLQQRDDFVASITHDLKNPLIGSNRIVEAVINGDMPADEQRFLLGHVLSSNKHMLHMIWNLLDTYKHHSGALVPSLAPVNLVALLHSILSEFSFQMKMKNQTANLEIQASFPDVHADKTLLRRAIFNLIDNAIKFTPTGGSINVSCNFDSTHIKLTVKDSGTGIPYEQRERLFQQFWQGCRGQENEIGTGLGLYLTKNIVELNGGTLECSSTEGAGAEFTIMLKREVETKT